MKYIPQFKIYPAAWPALFGVYSSNGKQVGVSETYTRNSSRNRMIRTLLDPAYRDKCTMEVRLSDNGDYHWVLLAPNNKVILWSAETYKRFEYANKMAKKVAIAELTAVW
jgi:uncharacterized protein YegP (UPF0339 family)